MTMTANNILCADMEMLHLMNVLQYTDSTFPVGTFSFSNGLETAAYEKIVHDAPTLEAFTRAASEQAAYTDGVAALHALRAAKADDYEALLEADYMLQASKMNAEARLMLARMGKKLAELGVKLFPENTLIARWLEDIRAEKTPGTYPVAQGLVFAAAGMDEKSLFCSHQYGVINMILGAALRLVRVSHIDTQLILQRLTAESIDMFETVRTLPLDRMQAFVPQMDVCASLHEKGKMRMFMN